MDRQTRRDRVHRYNHDGAGGLSDAERSGCPPALSAEQMEDLKALVLAGPDLHRPPDPQLDGLCLLEGPPRRPPATASRCDLDVFTVNSAQRPINVLAVTCSDLP